MLKLADLFLFVCFVGGEGGGAFHIPICLLLGKNVLLKIIQIFVFLVKLQTFRYVTSS